VSPNTSGRTRRKRDFLSLADLTLDEHHRLLARARELKALRARGQPVSTLPGRTLLLLFEKHSTRTRVSFEAAIQQLGGGAVILTSQDSQLSRGEPLEDTARVVSRYVDCIMFRTHGDDRLHTFARAATVPVINGLSDGGHPVQLLADLLTVEEQLGDIAGKTVAWIGDGASNMALSWIEAAAIFGFTLRIAAPEGYRPPVALLAGARGRVKVVTPAEAADGADVVTTDVWTSMGQEAEAARRRAAFASYCVDETLMARAKPGAIFLHCLPAHRGEEVSAAVLDGPRSAALDEAENRLHAQKALLEELILR
jgi:ornithine carbamoyltransferase